MISDLEEVLRQLLIRELPVKNGEINIEFDQPRREWSGRLNRPTLNIFLYDLRENNILREPQWQVERRNGNAEKRRTPVRIDLNYMITAWATEPEDEHYLLSRTLMALYRNPEIPTSQLPEALQGQPVPIPVVVASHDALQNVADIWGVLDNEIRPAIALTLTLAMNPYYPVQEPLVRTSIMRFGVSGEPEQQRLDPDSSPDEYWQIAGKILSREPLKQVRVVLVERGLVIPIDDQGRFSISNLRQGDYTLEIVVNGGAADRHALKVPSNEYDIHL